MAKSEDDDMDSMWVSQAEGMRLVSKFFPKTSQQKHQWCREMFEQHTVSGNEKLWEGVPKARSKLFDSTPRFEVYHLVWVLLALRKDQDQLEDEFFTKVCRWLPWPSAAMHATQADAGCVFVFRYFTPAMMMATGVWTSMNLVLLSIA